MSYFPRWYVLCTPSPEYFRSHAERIYLNRTKMRLLAEKSVHTVMFDLVNPNGYLDLEEHDRRVDAFIEMRRGEYDLVIFQGDVATPYTEAALEALHPETYLVNEAAKNSKLDFRLQLFFHEHPNWIGAS